MLDVCGNWLPVKLGSGHVDLISTVVSLPTGVNNNSSEPFRLMVVEKSNPLIASASLRETGAMKPSRITALFRFAGARFNVESFHLSFSSSLSPFASVMYMHTYASFQVISAAFNFSFCKGNGEKLPRMVTEDEYSITW